MGIYQGNDYRNYLAHKDHKYIDRIKTSYGWRYIYDLKQKFDARGDRKKAQEVEKQYNPAYGGANHPKYAQDVKKRNSYLMSNEGRKWLLPSTYDNKWEGGIRKGEKSFVNTNTSKKSLSDKIGEKTFGKIFSAIDANNARKQKQETAKRVQKMVDTQDERLKAAREENHQKDLDKAWLHSNAADNMKKTMKSVDNGDKKQILDDIRGYGKEATPEAIRLERQLHTNPNHANRNIMGDKSVAEYNKIKKTNSGKKALNIGATAGNDASPERQKAKENIAKRNAAVNRQGRITDQDRAKMQSAIIPKNNNKPKSKIDFTNTNSVVDYSNLGYTMENPYYKDIKKRTDDAIKNNASKNALGESQRSGMMYTQGKGSNNYQGQKQSTSGKEAAKKMQITNKFIQKYPGYTPMQVQFALNSLSGENLNKVTANDIKKIIDKNRK